LDPSINFNGTILKADSPIITAQSRALRYGDGIFETMLLKKGRLLLAELHFRRLFEGMQTLRFSPPPSLTPALLKEQITGLCEKNGHEELARVRLMIFRGEGGLYEIENNRPNFIIESNALTPTLLQFNREGLQIDIFPEARKAMDQYSHLKSNNYLVYAMAAFFVKEKGLDDAIILNSAERICDSTIANIFCVKDRKLFTPALSEGSVAGVMRRYLLDQCREWGFSAEEISMDEKFLLDADEVFLTNAVRGLQWVRQFRDVRYENGVGEKIHGMLMKE